jgi:hypothetical protein
MRWKFWRQNSEPPPCGAGPPQSGQSSPQRGASRFQRAEAALAALEEAWAGAASSPHGDERSPKQLALEFRRALQAQPDLRGWAITSSWVRGVYRLFCRAQGLAFPPAYRLFAEELALVMPRKRRDIRQGGKRTGTITIYGVCDPARSVVQLAAVERKRA